MKIGDFKIIYSNDELVFLNKDGGFLFSLGYKGDIEKLQEAINEPQKIRLVFSLFPFGFSIWDLSKGEKIGNIIIRLWR
ncbi:MAG: hypothetical protein CBR30_01680 [Dictyoglomus sp. NZ13-RE01]|nr:MAG: hypothetical protein CBR30_01680 [Dictyoglomus sp. NZ13-RE01]